MSNNDYKPQPIDLDDVQLPAELNDLVEKIAKNVHDVWAQNRLDQGWRYGEKVDNELKTHNRLVEYEVLPESEKLFDRATAISALKMAIKLGFKITK